MGARTRPALFAAASALAAAAALWLLRDLPEGDGTPAAPAQMPGDPVAEDRGALPELPAPPMTSRTQADAQVGAIELHAVVDGGAPPVDGRVRWVRASTAPYDGLQESVLAQGTFELPRAGTYYLVVEPDRGALPLRAVVEAADGDELRLTPAGEVRLRVERLGGAAAPSRVDLRLPDDRGLPPGPWGPGDAASRRERIDAYRTAWAQATAAGAPRSCDFVVGSLRELDDSATFSLPARYLYGDEGTGFRFDDAQQLYVHPRAPAGRSLQVVVEADSIVRFVEPAGRVRDALSPPLTVDPVSGADVQATLSRTLVYGVLGAQGLRETTGVRVVFMEKKGDGWQFVELSEPRVEVMSDLSFVAENVPAGRYVVCGTWREGTDVVVASSPIEVIEGAFNDVGPLDPKDGSVRVETSFEPTPEPEGAKAPEGHASDALLIQYAPTFEQLNEDLYGTWLALQVEVPFGETFLVRGLAPGRWRLVLTGGVESSPVADGDWVAIPAAVELIAPGATAEASLTYRYQGR